MSGHKRGSPRDAMGIFLFFGYERKGQVHPYRWSLKVLGLPVCVASAGLPVVTRCAWECQLEGGEGTGSPG